MPSYSYQIRKADHPSNDGTFDLHVHVWYNSKGNRTLLGRYRIPTLEPVFGSERDLTASEIQFLREWLERPEQLAKLNNCLRDTVFDSHVLGGLAVRYGIIGADEGETYINVRIPVSQRIIRPR